MPNWVMNKVEFFGDQEEIAKLKAFVKGETEFDFNKIIPMPESLLVEEGYSGTIAKACAKARQEGKRCCYELESAVWAKQWKTFDEWANMGEIYFSNLKKYGFESWYEWRLKNWGTKWDASDAEWHGDDYVWFETAWSMPQPIYEKLSELFPNIRFEADFADEDLGNNCGTVSYMDGSFNVEYMDDFDFACGVWNYDPDEMREEYESEIDPEELPFI